MMVSSNIEKKIPLVLPFACRVDVLNKLVKSEEGLPMNEILSKMIIHTRKAEEHIKSLEENKLIKLRHDAYHITSEGKELHDTLKYILKKANLVQT